MEKLTQEDQEREDKKIEEIRLAIFARRRRTSLMNTDSFKMNLISRVIPPFPAYSRVLKKNILCK